jgi:hypothetical protein
MSVQDPVRTVTIPTQAGPVDPPLALRRPAAPAPAPLVGRDRPRNADERMFLLGVVVMAVVLGTIIVVGLLLAQYG